MGDREKIAYLAVIATNLAEAGAPDEAQTLKIKLDLQAALSRVVPDSTDVEVLAERIFKIIVHREPLAINSSQRASATTARIREEIAPIYKREINLMLERGFDKWLANQPVTFQRSRRFDDSSVLDKVLTVYACAKVLNRPN